MPSLPSHLPLQKYKEIDSNQNSSKSGPEGFDLKLNPIQLKDNLIEIFMTRDLR